MRRLLTTLAAVIVTSASHAAVTATSAYKVGVTDRVIHPEAARNWRQAEHQELHVLVWYPAADTAVETKQSLGPNEKPLFDAGSAARDAALTPGAKKLPLILLSHGTGDSAEQLAWLGIALARAGFIVAAVNHPGNNAHERYTVEGFTLWWERATDVSQVLDAMLADKQFGERIDPKRVGASGFSLGAYTSLLLAGAQSDISDYYDVCVPGGPANKLDIDTTVCNVPETRDLGTPLEALRKTRATSAESLAYSGQSFEDDGIRAVFAIAPALAFTFDEDSLKDIHIPVQLVTGKLDRIAAARDNADYVHAMVHGSREDVLPNVNHYTFLDTCTPAGKESLKTFCSDAPGLEREAVHQQVANMAIQFFQRNLR